MVSQYSDPFDQYMQEEYSAQEVPTGKNPYSDPFEQYIKESVKEESFGTNAFRTLSQIPQGIASTTMPGLIAGAWDFLARGEVADPEDIERLKAISEREGVPFDEESYMEAAQRALGTIPTVSNIASKVEEKTGIPLEPKTKLQKGIRLGTEAARLAPQPGTFIGATTKLPSPILGAGVAGTSTLAQELGVPEPIADIASFGILKRPPEGAGSLSFTKTKPSGMPERGFERLRSDTDVSPKKIQQINTKLEGDFKQVSDKIIKESPIGETAQNLKDNPLFKRESQELLNQAQILADRKPGFISKDLYKNALVKQASKQGSGFALDEYSKNYIKFMEEAEKSIVPKNISYGQLVEQYRKNNQGLGEYFEPGASKALNRAKKDALLDQNRAIANVMEQTNPELSKVFKEGNDRWTKIMDVETIDNFISDMFPSDQTGTKLDFKQMKKAFEDPNYQRIFKRSLGKEGAKAFEGAVHDMLSSETPYKFLKETKPKGVLDALVTAKAYMINPKLGATKSTWDALAFSYRSLFNSILDKPSIGFNYTSGVNKLKKGEFKAAEKDFSKVKTQVEQIENKKPEVKAEPVNPIEKKRTESLKKFKETKKTKEEIKTPKLIEYKPTPNPKNSKEIVQGLSRKYFENAIDGKVTTPHEKNILKNTNVTLLSTRGKDQQFHGTRSPIKNLDADIFSKSSVQNIYGPGFYTTDALDIADGYSKTKFSKNPTVYEVKEITHQKLYNAEQPIKEFKNWWNEKNRKYFEMMKEKAKDNKYRYYDEFKGSFEDYLKNSDNLLDEILYDEKPKSIRELYDKIRERASNEGMAASEAQEYFDGIQSVLESKGYKGIEHKGGILTKNPEHKVKIYWNPENLEIQEFAYPKEFKKVQKFKPKYSPIIHPSIKDKNR